MGLTLNLDSLEPPQGTVASLLPNLRKGSENAKAFSEPPVRFELTTYALRVRCSTPELRWRTENSAFTSLLVGMQFTKYSHSGRR